MTRAQLIEFTADSCCERRHASSANSALTRIALASGATAWRLSRALPAACRLALRVTHNRGLAYAAPLAYLLAPSLQAATLYEKSGDLARCAASWESYVKRFPTPFEPAMEAREKLAEMAQARGDAPRRAALLADIVAADHAAGGARTDRSRYLAAVASLELAQPTREPAVEKKLPNPKKLAPTGAEKSAASKPVDKKIRKTGRGAEMSEEFE